MTQRKIKCEFTKKEFSRIQEAVDFQLEYIEDADLARSWSAFQDKLYNIWMESKK